MNSIPRITSIRTAWLLQNEKKKLCNGYTHKYKRYGLVIPLIKRLRRLNYIVLLYPHVSFF